jgi:hypothetical protein
MKLRVDITTTGSLPTRDGTITIYRGKRTYSINDCTAITERNILNAYRHIVKTEAQTANKYRDVSVGAKILKAEIIN